VAVEKVAVVGGTGDLGYGLALRWAKAGLEVVIGSREESKAKASAENLLAEIPEAKVVGLENGDAVGSAPIVVVAVPFSGFVPIYKSISERVSPETIVVDATVPVEASLGGKATHVFGVWEGSAAQLGLAFLPKGTKMCAGFHSLAASALRDLGAPLEGDVLVCGNKDGKLSVRDLVEAIPDLRYVDAGPLENARIIEPITALLIGLNHRYHTGHAGIHITGLPEDVT
jgi:NADPH-dependent F420 reductase